MGVSHSTPQLAEASVFTYDANNNTYNERSSFMDTMLKKSGAPKVLSGSKKDRRRTVFTSMGDLRRKEEPPVSQLQLDLLHARHIQIAFIHAKAQEKFEAEEMKVKEDILSISQMNDRLKKEVSDMKQKIAEIDAEISVGLILRAQEGVLEVVMEKLPSLEAGLARVKSAMQKGSQSLKMQNVVLNEESQMIETMQESARLLSQLNSLTAHHQPSVKDAASAAKELKDDVDALLALQKENADLFAKYKRLVNEERSLQVDAIQIPDF